MRTYTPRAAQASGSHGRRRGPAALATALLVLVLVGALGFAAAVAGSARLRVALLDHSGATTTSGALRALALAPLRFLGATASDATASRLALDVKFKHLHTLHEQRSDALRAGVLTTSDEDFVPASVDVEGRAVALKLRLAGEGSPFPTHDKWPLRIRARGGGHVFGMRRFELRAPEVRGFQAESLFLQHLRREDVLAPRFRFVDVILNGKAIGLMALEESPSVELLESQQRRDGSMLRFDASSTAAEPGSAAAVDLAGPTAAVAISPLRPREARESRSLSRGLATGTRLLRAYLSGKLDAGDVFDPDLTGRFLAVAELWGAQHALRWQNLWFYLNPLTARLEPIGHAANLQDPHRGDELATREAPFAAGLLRDPRIRGAFLRSLHRIAGEMLDASFSAAIREQESTQLRLLHREYPLRVPFDVDSVLERAARLRELAAAGAAPELPVTGGTPYEAKSLPLPESSLSETLARHPFLAWDEASQELRVSPGRWDVEGSLILPEGAGLALSAGTILRFQPKHGIIARGPLTFLGEASAPVVLEGPVGAKRSQLWSGVYVVESRRPSRWSHVVVRNTGGFKRDGWELAGGVVFRKTRVELEHCTLAGSRTDDALNLVRSSFSLRDVAIRESRSDAIDADYAEGSIVGGFISHAGGDGIDLGGSRVNVRGTHLANIGDKAISVGEGSRLSARGIEIEHVGIGLASKNGSEAEIADSTLRDIADVALVAYTNRPEFGPGSLTAEGNRIANATVPALAQTGSHVLLDGTILAPIDAAIDRLHKDAPDEP